MLTMVNMLWGGGSSGASDLPTVCVGRSVTEDRTALWVEDVPVHAEAATLHEAEEQLIDALVDYAEAWNDCLHAAPNHRHNHALVELVTRFGSDWPGLRAVVFR